MRWRTPSTLWELRLSITTTSRLLPSSFQHTWPMSFKLRQSCTHCGNNFSKAATHVFDKLSVVQQECWHTLRPRSRLSVSRGLNVGVDDRENATQRANATSGQEDLRRHHCGVAPHLFDADVLVSLGAHQVHISRACNIPAAACGFARTRVRNLQVSHHVRECGERT